MSKDKKNLSKAQKEFIAQSWDIIETIGKDILDGVHSATTVFSVGYLFRELMKTTVIPNAADKKVIPRLKKVSTTIDGILNGLISNVPDSFRANVAEEESDE